MDKLTDKTKHKELRKKLEYFLKGNQEAVQCCMQAVAVCHVWDDLIDRDKEIGNTEINKAFYVMLIDLQINSFFQQFKSLLIPVLETCIHDWWDANTLERGSDHDKHMAYTLRAAPIRFIHYCAYLVGGLDWIMKEGPAIRQIYEEPMNEFMKEMENA